MTSPSRPAPTVPLAPLGAVLLAMVSITLGASFAKRLFPVIGPAGTTALRLALAAVILSVVLRVWRLRLTRPTVAAALPYGLAMAGMNLFFYMAIARIPLGVAIAIEFAGPLTVAIALSRRRTDFAWIGLAVLGLALLVPVEGGTQGLDPVGAGFALLAGVCWGAYIVFGQRAGAVLGGAATAAGMIVSGLVVLPVGIAAAGSALLQPAVLAGALVVAVLSSALPYSLEMMALRRLPARSFGVLTSGEPAVGTVMGFLLLGESLAPLKLLGIAAIVAASLGTTLGSRTPPVHAESLTPP